MEKTLDITSLWPEFKKLGLFILDGLETGNIDMAALDADLISASIVALLFLIAVAFMIYTIFFGYLPARKKVFALMEFLRNLTPENLIQQRRTLNERAGEIGHVGNLWKKFDETLVVTGSGNQLYNTIDSSHFFNNHTLAPTLVENRLLAAVPGFLTAIGVIGTFAGLQMGLEGISFQGNVSDQQEDIQGVINGAAVAFMTSVWGVLTSVIFNFLEKIFEQKIKKHISKLQDRIDFLFPRISPEQSLLNIAASSSKSEDALNGLAERIGEQLQQAVSGMGEQVTAGIKEAMKPAMDSLVGASNDLADRQAGGAIDALSQLVARFMEKMSEAGEGQRQLMIDATSELKESIGSMHTQMNSFLDKLETQALESTELEDQSRIRLIEQLSDFSAQMSTTVNENVEASKASANRNEELAIELKDLTEKLSNVMGGLDSYSERMMEASTNIEQASSKVRSATLILENEIGKAIGAVKDLSTENGVMVQNTQQVLEQIRELQGELQNTAASVSEASKTVANTFDGLDERQQTFLQKQESALKTYEESMHKEFAVLTQGTTDFLKDYTEMVEQQTNIRLGAWNEQTAEFSRQMTNAVQVLQSVLSDVEDIIGDRG
ncbi:MAG: anti-phage ZorAB system protein ZorA [Proteobacteria bacterium]|nr:anti-phage ZorAB system protein ZorA [Pseudomonadota bacterium]